MADEQQPVRRHMQIHKPASLVKPGLAGEFDPVEVADGVTLALAVSDPDRMEACLAEAFERGVSSFVVFASERSPQGLAFTVMPRLEKALAELSQKDGRPFALSGPLSLFDLTELFGEFGSVALCWEEARRLAPKVGQIMDGASRGLVVIGPVDGFDRAEAEALTSMGATAATLGPKVLDVEDAVSQAVDQAVGALARPGSGA